MISTTAPGETAQGHVPVMLDEVVESLKPRAGEVYLDGTFGAGGYTRAFLQQAACRVFAIDRDPDAIARAQVMAQEFQNRLDILPGCFGDMARLLSQAGVQKLEGIVLDIGVSSIQLSSPERGFSFMHDGALDMRMSKSGPSAYDVVNKAEEKELADIIFRYGEEKAARRIANAIVRHRSESPIETTLQLAGLIEKVLGPRAAHKTHPATRTFQALRIYINDELGELERALASAIDLLKPGGRLVVVTFHSLEDSIVKNFLRQHSGRAPGGSRHLPPVERQPALFDVPFGQGLKPSAAEIDRNPRSRSARLRLGIRTKGEMDA